ncbi:MAG: prolipoprotein diacylglyceryl transferase [Bdellovibrionia bacterium]
MYPNLNVPLLGNIPTFFLLISIGISLGLIFAYKDEKPEHLNGGNNFSNLILLVLIGSLAGARLIHVVYENWEFYQTQPWSILAIWNGGFVFYGGFLGAIGLGHLYAYLKRWNRQDILKTYDFFAPPLALSYAVGRLGCFFNGCCFGKSCDAWFAISHRFPTTLLTSLTELIIFIFLLIIRKKQMPPGGVFFIWLPLHALSRALMESQRADFRGPTLGLSISSWISLVLIVISVFYWLNWYRSQKSS